MELDRRVRTRHGEIAFTMLGDGPPVVLVHGTPSRAAAWRDVAPALAVDHRVIVYDLLGFGDSDGDTDRDVGVATQGEVLADLVAAWGLDAPAVAGHDIGGATALRAHLVEGVAFSRLALVDAVVLRPWITDTTRRMQRELDRWSPPDDGLATTIRRHLETATRRPLPPGLRDQLFGQWDGAGGQARYLRTVRCLREEDTDPVEERLGALTIPVGVVWGADDAWLPVATSDRVARATGAPAPVVVPDAGHFCMLDAPDAVTAALRAFLAG